MTEALETKQKHRLMKAQTWICHTIIPVLFYQPKQVTSLNSVSRSGEIYSSSLSVMVCNTAMNTELINTEPLLPGDIQVKFLQVSGHVFTDRSIHNLVVCVFLFENTSLNIHCWFINIEFTANNTIICTWRNLSNMYFLCNTHHSFLVLRTAGQHISTVLRAIDTMKAPIKMQELGH